MRRWLLAPLIVAATAYGSQRAAAHDQMWIVGSAAVQAFTTAVATRVAKALGGSTPVIEDTGTALALEYLCGGVGAGYPNAASVTRRIKRRELDVCRGNGVAEVVEIPVGLDMMVVAQSKAGPPMRLTLAQMALALAREVPGGDGALIPNPYRKWSEVDPSLPDAPIDVRVLPEPLGAWDDVQDLFLQKGAKRVPAFARLARNGALPKSVQIMRKDRPSVMVHDTEDMIVRALVANPNAVGIFGYRFLQANRETLRSVPIDGADAEQDAYNGRYPGTRKLYLYVRKADIASVPGLGRLGAEYVSGAALGPDGYLLKLGFVPLRMDDMARTMGQVEALSPLQREMLQE